MIFLKANTELQQTFETLIQTAKLPVKWNGIFVILDNYVILEGSVRSLFFHFDSRNVTTNIIELPQKREVLEVGENVRVQNTINMVLYTFGKWGTIKGIRVEKDYPKLNALFLDIMQEYEVEPELTPLTMRFYKNGMRVTYEDVLQLAIAYDEEERQEEADSNQGLWHKLIWEKHRTHFARTDTTLKERRVSRIGNNFYMVGYLCPNCGRKLHMVVYPEGKEFEIQTEEGAVLLARAVTCEKCQCFFTPRPNRLLAEGDIYVMEFGEDAAAYEDYLELLGRNGERVSNYHCNRFVDGRMSDAEDATESLEELYENLPELSEMELRKLEARMEEGFYPDASVKRMERAVKKAGEDRQEEQRNTEEKKKPKKARLRGRALEIVKRNGQEEQKNAQEGQNAADKGTEPIKTAKAAEYKQAVSEHEQVIEDEPKRVSEERERKGNRQEFTAGNQRDRTKKSRRTDTAAEEWEELPKLEQQKAAGEPVKHLEGQRQSVVREEQEKAEWTGQGTARKVQEYGVKSQAAGGSREHSAAEREEGIKHQRAVAKVDETEMPEDGVKWNDAAENEGNAKRAEFAGKGNSGGSEEATVKIDDEAEPQGANIRRDEMPYNTPQNRAAQQQEITMIIRRARKKSRGDLTALQAELVKGDFLPELVQPYIEKVEARIRQIDAETIAQICPNPMQLTFAEAQDAYAQIAAGDFLPELKRDTLQMLKKRLLRIRLDECELLVHKLKEELAKAGIADEPRHHFYPAKKVLQKEALPEETAVIDYAMASYAAGRGEFEYPILVVDATRNGTGKEGIILTPEHFYYSTLFSAYGVRLETIARIAYEAGFLNRGLYMYQRNGTKIRLPYAVENKKLAAFAGVLDAFIQYLQEKPDSRSLAYLASETHETICCFRCGYEYAGGEVCPRCGYRNNE